MSEIIITTISKEEIQKFIENAVKTAILQKSIKDKKLNDTFLDVDQAATFLGIAKATLYGKCSKLIIPHFKKGKKLYFHQSELMEYLKSGRRKTIQDIQQKVNTQLSEKGEHYNARRSYR